METKTCNLETGKWYSEFGYYCIIKEEPSITLVDERIVSKQKFAFWLDY